jgi:hypothetical protein
MQRWTLRQIEGLLHDPHVRALFGEELVIVATKDWLGVHPRAELPDQLEAWAQAEAVPFTRRALETGRRGLAAADIRSGVPLVYLGPSEVRLALYDPVARRLGPWLWSYVDN